MTSGATQILSVFASISFSVLVAWKTARLFADRYDTEKMTTDELKTIIWRYFTSYWNNRRICSTNRGLPPMIKRQQYYASLKEAAQGSKSLRKMCQLILTISLRMVLPKKTSFEFLTQWDLRTIVDHINSTPRESLGGRTPYDVALDNYGIDILKALQLRPIPPDEVNLTPKLIRFNH